MEKWKNAKKNGVDPWYYTSTQALYQPLSPQPSRPLDFGNWVTYTKTLITQKSFVLEINAVGLIVLPHLTQKVKRFYRDQIWTIVGRKPSIFALRFWARYYSQNLAINNSVMHSFSGFQKGLALLPSSNGSEVINLLVKVTRTPKYQICVI